MDADEPTDTTIDSRLPDLGEAPLGGITEADSRRILDRVTVDDWRRIPSAYFQSAL